MFEEENNSLDFKQEQYNFVAASDHKKSELLKDVLAFCNSWRRTDAYILIGVKEEKGGKSNVIGITEMLDDAQLQQFVNTKTQRPVNFSYQNLDHSGKKIAVIHVPVQKKPIYLKKDFGKLRKNVVYIRRGSSTDEAYPDEVALMGNYFLDLDHTQPKLKLQFAVSTERLLLPNKFDVHSIILETPPAENIPDYAPSWGGSWGNISAPNFNYYKDLAEYYKVTKSVKPINFAVRNESGVVANDVRLKIEIPDDPNQQIIVLDEYDIPPMPSTSTLDNILQRQTEKHDIHVSKQGENWLIHSILGKIQPRDTVWVQSNLYFGAMDSRLIKLESLLFADNLSEPIKTELSVKVVAEHKKVDLSQIKSMPYERY